MKKMKSVLLIFDDQKESEFIEANLMESGYVVASAIDLESGSRAAERVIPDLIVIKTLDNGADLHAFSKRVKTERLNNVSLLSLIELEDYLKMSVKEHFVVKPVRPKLLLSLIRSMMNNEVVDWLPSFR